jgi:autotransporter-associated beta strand protein
MRGWPSDGNASAIFNDPNYGTGIQRSVTLQSGIKAKKLLFMDGSYRLTGQSLAFTGNTLEVEAQSTVWSKPDIAVTLSGNSTTSLVKKGAGLLTLSGAGNNFGSADVQAGALLFNNGSLPPSPALKVQSGASLSVNSTGPAFAQNLSGAGTFVKLGSGSLTFSSAGTFSGGTLYAKVSSGTLRLSPDALPNGGTVRFTVEPGATLAFKDVLTPATLPSTVSIGGGGRVISETPMNRVSWSIAGGSFASTPPVPVSLGTLQAPAAAAGGQFYTFDLRSHLNQIGKDASGEFSYMRTAQNSWAWLDGGTLSGYAPVTGGTYRFDFKQWVPMPMPEEGSPFAVGGSWAYIVRSDGSVRSWGGGFSGVKEDIAGNDWNIVAAGTSHVLLLKKNGGLWARGRNSDGQLGLGNTQDQMSAVQQVGTRTDWKSVAARQNSSFAIDNQGRLWAWGKNDQGQLGIGSYTPAYQPTLVGQDTDWREVIAGGSYTLAMKQNGSLYAWGFNGAGQLGLGNNVSQNTPQLVSGSLSWDSVSTGGGCVLGLTGDRQLYAWGNNINGQFGDGTTTGSSVPKLVSSAPDWDDISVGSDFVVAMKTDGSVYTWGQNGKLQLGQVGSVTSLTSPTLFKDASEGWIGVLAGGQSAYALSKDGSLRGWGLNENYQLGGQSPTNRYFEDKVLDTGWVRDLILDGTLEVNVLPGIQSPELTWGGSGSTNGSGTWDLVTTNWRGAGGTTAAWTNDGSKVAVFSGTLGFQSGTVSLSGGTQFLANGLRFGWGTSYALSGGTLMLAGSNGMVHTDALTRIESVIGGSQGLTKVGGGTLVLAGANNYVGQTAAQSGTLKLVDGGSLGMGSVWVSQGATFVVDRASDYVFGGTLQGGGVFEKLGGGSLTLSGSNYFGGQTRILGGTLNVTPVSLQKSGSVNVALGARLSVEGVPQGQTFVPPQGMSVSGPGEVYVNGAPWVPGGQGLDLTWFGSGQGTGTGTGTWDMTTTNWRGDGGTMAAWTNDGSKMAVFGGSLGSQSGTVSLSGGTQFLANGLKFESGTNYTLSGGTLVLAGSNGMVRADGFARVESVIGGSYGLTKVGGGMLVLAGSNNYVGQTAVQSGTLKLVDGGSLGMGSVWVNQGATFVVDRASDYVFGGTLQGQGVFEKLGGGSLTLSGSNQFGGQTRILGGTVNVTPVSLQKWGSVNVAFGARLSVEGVPQGQTFVPPQGMSVSGPGEVYVNGSPWVPGVQGLELTWGGSGQGNGSGPWDLATTNWLSAGGTSAAWINDGSKMAVFGGSLGLQSGTVSLSGGTQFSVSGLNFESGTNYTLSGGTLMLAGSNGMVRADGFARVESVIGGSSGLTKVGGGMLVLAGSNNYVGQTAVQSGTLRLTGAGLWGERQIQVGSTGRLELETSSDLVLPQLSIAPESISRVVATDSSVSVYWRGGAVGVGPLFVEPVTVVAGTLKTVDLGNRVTSAGGNLTQPLHYEAAPSDNWPPEITVQPNGVVTFNPPASLQWDGGQFTVLVKDSSTPPKIRSVVLDVHLYPGTSLPVLAGQDQTLDVATLNWDSSVGQILRIGSIQNLPFWVTVTGTQIRVRPPLLEPAQAVNLTVPLVFSDRGNTFTRDLFLKILVSEGSSDGTRIEILPLLSPRTLEVGMGQVLTLAGGVTGSYGFTKTGAGKLILSGSSNYSGATSVDAGTLVISATNAPPGRPLSIGSAGLVELGVSQAFSSLTGSGSLKLVNGSTLRVQALGDSQFDGTVSGAGAFVKAGSATLMLGGSQSYTAGLTVESGSLVLSRDYLLSPGAPLRLEGGTVQLGATVQNVSEVEVYSGQILGGTLASGAFRVVTGSASAVLSGAGGLVKMGTGVFTLSGNNNYAGETVVESGTLRVTPNALQGTGRVVTVRSGASLVFDGVSGDLSLPGLTLNASPGQVTASGSPGQIVWSNGGIGGNSPVIQGSPVGGTYGYGNPITLRVTASGTSLSYQWKRNGFPIRSAPDSPVFEIGQAQLSDSGTYSVVVSNPFSNFQRNSPESAPANVVVQPNLAFVTGVEPQVLALGSTLRLRVTVQGAPDSMISYQWYKGNTLIERATSSTYEKSQFTEVDQGNYSVRVSAGGSTISSAANVWMGTPLLQMNPINQVSVRGGSVAFSVAHLNAGVLPVGTPVTYEWAFNGKPLTEAGFSNFQVNGGSLFLNNVSDANQGAYGVKVTAGTYGFTTATGYLTTAGVSIVGQPQSVQARLGQRVALSVQANGSNLTYQWYKGTTPIPDARQATYPIPALTEDSAGSYSVVVTSDVTVAAGQAKPSAVSTPAVVSIFVPVTINEASFQQQARTLSPGQRLSLNAFALGTPPFSYVWRKDGQPIQPVAGGTLANFVIDAVKSAPSDTGRYSVSVSQTDGTTVTSSQVQITVRQSPTLQPLAVRVNQALVSVPPSGRVLVEPNALVSLSVQADSTEVSYQWRRNQIPLPDLANRPSRQATLAFNASAQDQEGRYDVVVSNSAGASTSGAVEIGLTQPPVVLQSPLTDVTVVSGSASRLRWSGFQASAATGYRWAFQGTEIPVASNPSAGTPTLEINGVSAANAGSYTVTAFNAFSSVTSSANLSVLQPAGVPIISGSLVANPGQTMQFTASATGDQLRYQWLLDGQVVPGYTGASLALAADSIADGKTHTLAVRASNADPSGKTLSKQNSDSYSIRVRVPLAIASLTPSRDQLVGTQGTVPFEVRLSGDQENVQYRWYRDGAVVQEGTQSTYTASAAGRYWVSATGPFNTVVSSAVKVNVKQAVTILQHPQGRTVNSGREVTFTVNASGSGVLSYLWRKNGVQLTPNSNRPAINEPTLRILNPQSEDEGSYDVVVVSTDSDATTSTATSLPADLALSDAVQIQSLTVDRPKLLTGGTASFTVRVASGDASKLRFQWRQNGQSISGAITQGVQVDAATVSSTLVLRRARVADQGDYDVVVTKGGVGVVSPVASLRVFAPLSVTASPTSNLGVLPDEGGALLQAVVPQEFSGLVTFRWFNVAERNVTLSESASWRAPASDSLASYAVEVALSLDGSTRAVAESAPVSVRLLEPVSFVRQPSPQTVTAGTPVELSPVIQGGGNLQFQWERLRSGRWVNVPGANAANLLLNSPLPSDDALYRVLVTNPRGSVRSEEVRLTVHEQEVIVTQPTAQTVNPGDAAVFEVRARGVDLTYQWRKNGVPIAGATSSILSVPAAADFSPQTDKADREGSYDVLVSHAFGSSVSVAARLLVNVPVSIQLHPADTLLLEGKSAKLVVVATGTPELRYRWRKNQQFLDGGTQSFYLINSASASDAGNYDVVVENAAGRVVSASASVSVVAPVEISQSPQDVLNALPGSPVSFTVEATGSSLQYQWRKDGVALVEGQRGFSGTRTSTLLLAAVDPGTENDLGSAGRYDVVVSNTARSLASLPAVLTINAPPVIEVQPRRQVVHLGDGVRFSVKARGPGLNYQWFVKSPSGVKAPVPAAKDGRSEYLIANVSQEDFGSFYSVVVSNASGSISSVEAKLSQFPAIRLTSTQGAQQAASDSSLTVRVGSPVNASVNGTPVVLLAPAVIPEEDVVIVYQWRKNGVNLPGKTDASLSLNFPDKTVSGVYDVVLTALFEGAERSRVVSAASLVTVSGPPEIEAMATQKVRPGQSVLFAPNVKGGSNLTHQWYKVAGQSLTELQTGPTLSVDAPSGMMRVFEAKLEDNGTYELRATDVNGTSSARVQLVVTPPLSVTVRANGSVLSGGSLALKARSRMVLEATATPDEEGPFRYQWRFNGGNIMGAIRSRFEVPSVLATHAGRYDVVVSGASDRVSSPAFQLSLLDPLKIVTQPSPSVSVNQGGVLELSVQVNRPGEGETYQWFKGVGSVSEVLVGKTSSTLRISPVTEDDAGAYLVVVTPPGGTGRLSSVLSRVSVNLPVEISVQPTAQSVLPGRSASFQVEVGGTPPFTYQWLRNGVRIPGASLVTSLKTNAFQIPSASVNDGATYQVLVSNAVTPQGVLSAEAALTVSKSVVIVDQPKDNRLLTAGTLLSGPLLSVKAEAEGTVLSYQWRRNGIVLPRETGPNLATSKALTVYDSGVYDVVVRNTVGGVEVSRVESRKATIVVAPDPSAADPTGTVGEIVRAKEGDTVAFSSYAAADRTTNWVLEGGTLDAARARASGNLLTLRSVTAADAGIYRADVTGAGSVRWLLQVVSIPEISKQPVPLVGDLAVHPGSEAVLSAEVKTSSDAETDRDTHLRWYFQASLADAAYAIPGASGNTLRISKVSAQDDGYYRLEVSNPAGTVSSQPVRIQVLQPVQVSAMALAGGSLTGGTLVMGNPGAGVISGGSLVGGTLATSVNPGSAVTLRATTQGDLIKVDAFQWYYLNKGKVWVAIPRAVHDTLTFQAPQESNDTFYRVRAFGLEGGGVDSLPVRLSVRDAVSFERTQRKQNLSWVEGDSATLSVVANGFMPQYEWYRNGTLISSGTASESIAGGTLLTYRIPSVAVTDAGSYTLTLRNGFSGPVSRAIADVALKTPARFIGPNDGTPLALGAVTTDAAGVIRADEGSSFRLKVQVVEGCAPFTYQWRRNGVPLPSAQAKGSFSAVPPSIELPLNAVTRDDSGQYDVVVTNNWGVAISSPVKVLVLLKPAIVTQPKSASGAEGGAANFSVVAEGQGNLTYRWYRGTTQNFAIDSAELVGTGALYSRAPLTANDNRTFFRVVVSTDYGSFSPAISDAAILTVTKPGDFTVNVRATVGGVLASTPLSALPGDSVSLSAVVSPVGNYTYVWRKDGLEIPGVSSSVLPIGPVQNESAGVYDVIVSDGANFSYGQAVRLVVDPHIDSLEVPASVNPGDGVKLTVKATSSRALTYQWFRNSQPIDGANADVYAIASVSQNHAGTYSVRVSSANGGVLLSASRVMTVAGAVSISQQPVASTVSEGTELGLSVIAENATSYRWYRTLPGGGRTALVDGNGIAGSTASNLRILSVSAGDAGVYQVEVSNTGGSLLSVPVPVEVVPPLSVSLNSLPSVRAGTGVNLVASVVGGGSLSYQWWFKAAAAGSTKTRLEQQTSDRIRINPVSVSDAGQYFVEVASGGARVEANTVLSVLAVPEIVVAPASQTVALGGSATFAVVARYDGPLVFQWFRGSGDNRTQVLQTDGSAASQLRLSSVTADKFGTYTVRVFPAANPEAAVEKVATLTEKTSVPATETPFVLSTRWWVYWVDATAANLVNDRSGYWVVERITVDGVTRAGQSAWIWTTKDGTPLPGDSWTPEDQQMQEFSESARSEFSVVANRISGSLLQTFILSGRVLAGGEASVYGAPDVMEGEYDLGNPLALELSWDAEKVLRVSGATSLDAVKSLLQPAAALPGD